VAPFSLEALQFIRYFFTASLGIALIEVLHRDRRKARAALEELEREVKRREKTEEELRQAETRLRRHADLLEQRVEERTAHLAATVESLRGLLYHIAHNLRAPLRAMEGYSHLLITEHGPKLDAIARGHLLHIGAASKRMDELIQDLLAYGRLGHIEVAIRGLDLGAAVNEALFALQLEIQRRNAVVRIDGSLPAVLADPQILKEVLANLLENAIKFVPPETQPQVTLRAERRGSEVRLLIEDNGVGIEPRFHQRIFEVFEALYPGNGQSGTGIGLAIVKQGMQRMHGAVGLESEPGAGSRFWIELPGA
jgi:signal transduction histidine kinase